MKLFFPPIYIFSDVVTDSRENRAGMNLDSLKNETVLTYCFGAAQKCFIRVFFFLVCFCLKFAAAFAFAQPLCMLSLPALCLPLPLLLLIKVKTVYSPVL